MIFEVTPSQTVGPYFAIGVPFDGGNIIVPENTPGQITITGTIYDGVLAARRPGAVCRHLRLRRAVDTRRFPRLRPLRR
jgi:hypothetical protein